eukprot:265486-Rhodomonas_salina.1
MMQLGTAQPDLDLFLGAVLLLGVLVSATHKHTARGIEHEGARRERGGSEEGARRERGGSEKEGRRERKAEGAGRNPVRGIEGTREKGGKGAGEGEGSRGWRERGKRPVSYTHLTLPTICSV